MSQASSPTPKRSLATSLTLPTEVRSVYSSVVAAEISIASKGGFNIPAPGQTGTATGNAAAPAQTAAVGAAAGIVAGFLGVMAVL